MKGKNINAFTLVELMVVIAALAILLTVIIPSFMGFIDRGRFSNDVQYAKTMTNHLEIAEVDGVEQYDAYDIRQWITLASGEPVDFTPESRDTGFFYIASTQTVIASKYDDIESYLDARSLIARRDALLSDHRVDQHALNSPEELFGNGAFLLTTEGSAVAMAVDFIRNMADAGSQLGASHASVLDAVESYRDNPFIRFFGMGLSAGVHERVLHVLDYYDPMRTLFVNNVSWVTAATDFDAVNAIVFAGGVSHIPSFDLDLTNKMTIERLRLPRTIKTVSAGGFPESSFDIDSVVIDADLTLIAEPGAFPETTHVSRTILYDTIGLVDYSNQIDISVGPDGSVEYDLNRLSIRDSVTGYSIDNKDGFITLKIYTRDGLIGFASNAYTVFYYINTEDMTEDVVYYLSKRTDPFFVLPPDPYLVGYRLDGWYTNPEGQGLPLNENDTLHDRLTNVYAKWIEESEG